MLMERHGYEVIAETDNGVDALQLAREHLPDIVILDIGIPKLDGLEVIARLTAMTLPFKVLILTSQAPGHFSMRCMQAGAAGYDQPVMGVEEIILGHELHQFVFHFNNVLARGDSGAVADPENMRVHRHGQLAECCIEHDVSGLASYAR
nr:putative LOV domain-containing protein [Tanacetum cinerariifolium]